MKAITDPGRRGMTLVEMLVALTVGLLVLTLLFTLLRQSRVEGQQVDIRLSRLQAVSLLQESLSIDLARAACPDLFPGKTTADSGPTDHLDLVIAQRDEKGELRFDKLEYRHDSRTGQLMRAKHPVGVGRLSRVEFLVDRVTRKALLVKLTGDEVGGEVGMEIPLPQSFLGLRGWEVSPANQPMLPES